LQNMQQNPGSIHQIVGQSLKELRPGLEPAPHVSFDCIDIRPAEARNLEVSPQTMQSLHCAQAVNAAVKSVITDGGPNQAPDVLRTSGRNVLLYNKREELFNVAKSEDNDLNGQHLGPKYYSHYKQLVAVDHERKQKSGIDVEEMLHYGEDSSSVLTDCYKSAATGTGKCAEHAYTSFALLTDPQSLQSLGVDIPDGSLIILACGNQIDHTYVFIAEPDAVTISDERDRRVQVNDPRKVVVVDPWMPVPCAHTLDRSTADIQQNPVCKLVVAKQADGMKLQDRHGRETALPPPPQPVLEMLESFQENHRAQVLQHAQEKEYLSPDEQANLVLGVGEVVRSSIIGFNSRPPFYRSSHMSTHTPLDTYHCGGPSVSFFTADPSRHAQALQSIQTSNQQDPVDVLLDEDHLRLLKTDPAAQKAYPHLGTFFSDPEYAQKVPQRCTTLPPHGSQNIIIMEHPQPPPPGSQNIIIMEQQPPPPGSQNIIMEQQPPPPGSQNIIIMEPQPPPPAPPKAKKTLREDPEMRSTMENVEKRSSRQRQPLSKPETSSSSIRGKFNK
ncbi:MAG: hypothetical protein WAW39_24800, partial [Prosthecobacter sp.]